ncbi:hypothetical protein F5050DRAFT_1768365 [Lentinula boryana]|uniref:Uncharacterized protein n=1 Tax=Lentinula boryana TaxID=40481 RepID=A0ABQ8Q9R6_9AGAR|nr:hypothetical protein F5050DRAFT_1768365 [Lentinula boryana]
MSSDYRCSYVSFMPNMNQLDLTQWNDSSRRTVNKGSVCKNPGLTLSVPENPIKVLTGIPIHATYEGFDTFVYSTRFLLSQARLSLRTRFTISTPTPSKVKELGRGSPSPPVFLLCSMTSLPSQTQIPSTRKMRTMHNTYLFLQPAPSITLLRKYVLAPTAFVTFHSPAMQSQRKDRFKCNPPLCSTTLGRTVNFPNPKLCMKSVPSYPYRECRKIISVS